MWEGGLLLLQFTVTCEECERGDCFSSSLLWHVGNVRGGLLLLQFTVTCGECERGDWFYCIENISSNCVKNIIFLENKKTSERERKFYIFVINNLTILKTKFTFHMILRKVYFLIWVKSCMDYGLSKIPLKYEIRNFLLIHRKFRFRKGRLIN